MEKTEKIPKGNSIKPYYQDKWVTIYHGDCLAIMADLEASIVNMIFADPPFNVGKKYGNNGDRRDDYYVWCEQWIDACFTKLSDVGVIYLMTLARHLQALYPMLGSRGVFINEVHWRNVSASHSKRSFWSSYQPILIYGKTENYYFDTYAQKREIQVQNLRWGGYSTQPRGQLLDYWDDIPFIYAGSIHHSEAIMEPFTNEKAHPCQMPTELATRAIMFSSRPNELILDPFLGSGTTCFCAKKLNRYSIGIEIEEKYCEIAARRCCQEVMDFTK